MPICGIYLYAGNVPGVARLIACREHQMEKCLLVNDARNSCTLLLFPGLGLVRLVASLLPSSLYHFLPHSCAFIMIDEERNVQLGEKGIEENKEVVFDTFDTVSSEDYAKERAAVSSAYEVKSKLSTYLHVHAQLDYSDKTMQSTSASKTSASYTSALPT